MRPLAAKHGNDRGRPVEPAAFVAPSLDVATLDRQRSAALGRQEEARVAGYNAGYEAGFQLAQVEVDEMVDHHRRARDRFLRAAYAIENGLEQLESVDRVSLAAIERDVLELAVALATEIVGREVEVSEPVRDSIARALRLAPDRGVPVLHVHPDDARMARDVLASDSNWQGAVDVVGDVRVEPGGCVLEVGECRIDAQVGPAVARMRSALLGD